MLVIIVGGGRVGSHLARLLLEQGHQIRLIESDPEVIALLHRELPTESIVIGDPLDPEVLRYANIEIADVVVTTTPDDAMNLAVASLAKHEFRIPRIIGQVNNPRYTWLYRPEMGIDVAHNQTDILARLIEEDMSLGDMVTLLTLSKGDYSLVAEKVPPGARAIGTMLKNLPLPENCVIAAIFRAGEVIVPRGITTFEAGDEILAVVDRAAAGAFAKLLAPG